MSDHITICGWDIGGAHVKAAGLDKTGRVLFVRQYPAPLWQGPEILQRVLTDAARDAGLQDCEHAVTMTGELADCFRDREQGVAAILGYVGSAFPAARLRVYAGEPGLLEPGQALGQYAGVASANWLASAAWLARHYTDGVLVDIGSTTTDLVPFRDGRPAARGRTDFERLGCGELVYTGIVRTPVMALVREVPFHGDLHPVIPELFATMADVYRLTGELQPHHDLLPGADGGGKNPGDSARRLARMLGLDLEDAPDLQAWQELARYIAAQQLQRIAAALPADCPGSVLIGAGCGRFLVPALARERGCEWVDFDAHLYMDAILRDISSDCAAAVSVAQLALLQP